MLCVQFNWIESLLESVHIFSFFCFIYVFFLLCSFLFFAFFCFLLALSDKRRQSAKPGCSGTNLSITTDGTLTTCTLKIKPALKACAWQPSLWKWLQRSATERGVWEKNKLRKQQWNGWGWGGAGQQREKKRKAKVRSKRKRRILALMVGMDIFPLPILI